MSEHLEASKHSTKWSLSTFHSRHLQLDEEDSFQRYPQQEPMPDPTKSDECKTFSKLATPTMVSCFFACLPATINLAFAGHFDNVEKIAGVGLGNICLFLFCFTLLTGLNSA